jgi:hypothetical protein
MLALTVPVAVRNKNLSIYLSICLIQETSMRDMMVSEIFSTALSKGNPFVKQEIFQWLSTSLPEGKGINKVSV